MGRRALCTANLRYGCEPGSRLQESTGATPCSAPTYAVVRRHGPSMRSPRARRGGWMSGVTGSTQGFMPPRMSTGIPGLDEVLGGGLPQGNMYLVEGESGAGKTTLGLQFLLEGKRRGERTLWITLSETATQLLQS